MGFVSSISLPHTVARLVCSYTDQFSIGSQLWVLGPVYVTQLQLQLMRLTNPVVAEAVSLSVRQRVWVVAYAAYR